MGQQLYETQLLAAFRDSGVGEWNISEREVSALRAPRRPGRLRLPLRLVWALPYNAAATVGNAVYGRRADLVHRLDLRCPPSGRREVVTIHDLPPLRFDDEGSLPRWSARSARAAAAVICPSEFAADEARALLGVRRTLVVPNGVDQSRAEAEPLSAPELAALGLSGRLVVHAGGATQRKNLAGLAAAWPEVLPEHPDAFLVLCGPPHPRRALLFAGVDRVRYLGLRDPGFVARLMRTAAAVVVPSSYEGFGLPALEGMVASAAVVAAARGALPEVCGDAALVVEPTPSAIAQGISEALAGGEAIDRMRAAGRRRALAFSWSRAASGTAAVYEEALA
jgi:glycosyltransferase involved in cell wall biosynthesis